jgi:hypothetical protein
MKSNTCGVSSNLDRQLESLPESDSLPLGATTKPRPFDAPR